MITNMFNILDNKFDLQKQIKEVVNIFYCNTYFIYQYDDFRPATLEDIVDCYCIHLWKQRGNYITCYEIREALGLDDEKLKKRLSHTKIVLFLEYIKNIIFLLKLKYPDYASLVMNTNFICLENNINQIIDRMGYVAKEYRNEEKVLIIKNDILKQLVVDKSHSDGKDIDTLIYKYEHKSLKGNLMEKKSILSSIYREYEKNIFESHDKANFSKYYDLVNFYVNNANIRHNNEKIIKEIDKKELELVYDKLYKLMLFCILTKDTMNLKNELEQLKPKFIIKKEK